MHIISLRSGSRLQTYVQKAIVNMAAVRLFEL